MTISFGDLEDKSNILAEKLQYWQSHGKIEEFYNNLIPSIHNAPAVEFYDAGYITVKHDHIQFDCFETGNIHALTKYATGYMLQGWTEQFDAANTMLYDLSVQAGNFRVNRLITSKPVVVNGSNWRYLEFTSPNAQYGKSMIQVAGSNKSRTYELTRDVIDQTAILIQASKIVLEQYSIGVPKSMYVLSHLYQDDMGWFWSDYYNWNTGQSASVNNTLTVLNNALDAAVKFNNLTLTQKSELITYAESKWNT